MPATTNKTCTLDALSARAARLLDAAKADRDLGLLRARAALAIEAYREAGAQPVALAADPTPLPSEGAPGADKTPPKEFRIWAFGKVETTKGTFLFDKKAAQSVMSLWRDYGNRLTLDYEHKAIDPDRRAGDGKAAGSCLLELRADGLWAVDMRWTPKAAQELSHGEWLYFSPYFVSDEKSGRILELFNIALTNIPATKRMQPLVAAAKSTRSLTTDKDTTMATKKTKADASDDAETMAKAKAAKLQAAKTRMAKALAEMEAAKAECDSLDEGDDEAMDGADGDGGDAADGLKPAPGDDDDSDKDFGGGGGTGKVKKLPADDGDGDADAASVPDLKGGIVKKMGRNAADRVLAAVVKATGKTDPDEIAGALAALSHGKETEASNAKAIAALEDQLRAERSGKKISAAMRAGRLTPKMKAYACTIKSEKELDAYLESLPEVVATPDNSKAKKADTTITVDAANISISKNEEKIATSLGLSVDDYKKAKAQNETRRAALAQLEEDGED